MVENSFVLLSTKQVDLLREQTLDQDDPGDGGHEGQQHPEVFSDSEDVDIKEKKISANLDRHDWSKIVGQVMRDVESFIPAQKLFAAKILMKEILRNNQLAISRCGRKLQIKNGNFTVNLIDFIKTSIRLKSPLENGKQGLYPQYRKIVQILINNSTPESVFKNHLLTQQFTSAGRPFGKKHKKKKVRKNSQSNFGSQYAKPYPGYLVQQPPMNPYYPYSMY